MAEEKYYRYKPLTRVWVDDSSAEPIRIEDPDVKGLYYHMACGEGDKHYVDVVLTSGHTQRLFVFHAIEFEEPD